VSTHQEIELKFQIPDRARAAVRRAVSTAKAEQTRLQAVYFDTADRRLAAAGIAVRLRLEGTQWVQTAKAGDPHAMQRHEHNVPVDAPPNGEPPALELSRHDGTRAGKLLQAALAATEDRPAGVLSPLYRTDILRTHRIARSRYGNVELALDIGELVADDRRLPVFELEIELVGDDDPHAVIDVAHDWVRRHGLWIDVRSKAERGDRLARNVPLGTAVKSRPPQGRAGAVGGEAYRAALAAGVAHVLPNLGDVASGTFTQAQVRQLRRGLQQLRTTFKLFDGVVALPDDEVVAAIQQAGRDLGQTRDRDVLAQSWQAWQHAPEAPSLTAPEAPAIDSSHGACHIARRPELTAALIALKALELSDGTRGPQANDWPDALIKRLHQWHKRIRRDARAFSGLDAPQRHALRKHIKRLDDALKGVAFLFKDKPLEPLQQALAETKSALGHWRDDGLALDAWREAVAHDARAWFAVGWLTARQSSVEQVAEDAIARLAALPLITRGVLKKK
jgi:inorganic triphosphatase YgiF